MTGILGILGSGGIVGDIVFVITTATAGSQVTPAGKSKFTGEAIGGGGNGFANNTSGNRAGGAGGLYAKSNVDIAVTGGSTTIFYSVGAAATQSWVRAGTNAAPVASTDGALAKNGGNASSATAGLGNTAGSVGSVTRNGANGGVTGSAVGGGAAGRDAAGSGQTGGGDTSGISVVTMAGGAGGNYQVAGTAPGGGGGADTAAGGTKAGAIGRVRMLFKT